MDLEDTYSWRILNAGSVCEEGGCGEIFLLLRSGGRCRESALYTRHCPTVASLTSSGKGESVRSRRIAQAWAYRCGPVGF